MEWKNFWFHLSVRAWTICNFKKELSIVDDETRLLSQGRRWNRTDDSLPLIEPGSNRYKDNSLPVAGLPSSRGAIPVSQLHSSLIHREHRTRTGVSPPLFIRRIVFRSRTTSFNDKSPGRLSKSPSSIGETVPITPFFEMKFKFKERRNDWKTVNECERRWIPFPPSWNEGGRERKGTRTTTTTTTTSTRRVVETGWSNFSQHFSSSSAQTRWTLAEMQYPSWLRNGRGAFPWWCLLRRCPAYVISIPRPPSSSVRPVSIIARTFLFIFSPSPLFPSHLCLRYTHRLPILVALSRPRQFPFSRSAFQFIPFAGFASLFPLSLPHFRDIKPWFSRFDPTACHNTMARLQRRRQPRSFSSSIVGVNRAPSRWLLVNGERIFWGKTRYSFLNSFSFFIVLLVNLILKKY